MSNRRKNIRISRKNFVKQASLTALGMGLFYEKGFSKGTINYDSDEFFKGYDYTKKDAGIIRTIAYNVFNGCIGYIGINGKALTQNFRSTLVKAARDSEQIPGRMVLELALYDPNIINFSESPGKSTVADIAEMLGFNYAFFPGAKDGKGHFPGCVLTNYEITSWKNRPFVEDRDNSDILFTRHWGKAGIKLPNGQKISVHSAHLWPFKKNDDDTRIRMNEIDQILKAIRYDLENGFDSVLLQGDLNHSPDMAEYKKMNSGIIKDVFLAQGSHGEPGYTYDSIEPVKRIDFIYAGGEILKDIVYCQPLFQGNFRTNINDPVSFALSDHLPLMADFKLS